MSNMQKGRTVVLWQPTREQIRERKRKAAKVARAAAKAMRPFSIQSVGKMDRGNGLNEIMTADDHKIELGMGYGKDGRIFGWFGKTRYTLSAGESLEFKIALEKLNDDWDVSLWFTSDTFKRWQMQLLQNIM